MVAGSSQRSTRSDLPASEGHPQKGPTSREDGGTFEGLTAAPAASEGQTEGQTGASCTPIWPSPAQPSPLQASSWGLEASFRAVCLHDLQPRLKQADQRQMALGAGCLV